MKVCNYKVIKNHLKRFHCDIAVNLGSNGFDKICEHEYDKGDKPKEWALTIIENCELQNGLIVYVVDYNHWKISFFHNPKPKGRLEWFCNEHPNPPR